MPKKLKMKQQPLLSKKSGIQRAFREDLREAVYN